jgi:hypothetical protein
LVCSVSKVTSNPIEWELKICPLNIGFQWGSCYSIFSFMCMFCRSLFVLLYFFFWPLCCLFAILLYVRLRSTDSDYPFGIFKLFLVLLGLFFRHMVGVCEFNHYDHQLSNKNIQGSLDPGYNAYPQLRKTALK